MEENSLDNELSKILNDKSLLVELEAEKFEKLEQELRQVWVDTAPDDEEYDQSKVYPTYRQYPGNQERWAEIEAKMPNLLFVGYIQARVIDTITPCFVHRDSIVKINLDDQGRLHSENDEPALVYTVPGVEDVYNVKIWMNHGEFKVRQGDLPNYVSHGIEVWYKPQQGFVDNDWISYAVYNRSDGPAYIASLSASSFCLEHTTKIWYQDGQPYRNDGLYTEETYDADGNMIKASVVKSVPDPKFTINPSLGWALKGDSNSSHDKPSYFSAMKYSVEDDQLKPYIIGEIILDVFMPKSDQTILEWTQTVWTSQDRSHREEDKPASITTHKYCEPDGSTKSFTTKEWFYHGKRHRLNGPALIKTGDETATQWFWFGKEVDQDQHEANRLAWTQS